MTRGEALTLKEGDLLVTRGSSRLPDDTVLVVDTPPRKTDPIALIVVKDPNRRIRIFPPLTVERAH